MDPNSWLHARMFSAPYLPYHGVTFPWGYSLLFCRFYSIGLRKYGTNTLRSLLISLIPPVIFIAVMAMQLRFFSPVMSRGNFSDTSSLDLSRLLPSSLRSSFSQSGLDTKDSAMEAATPAENLEERVAPDG